mmetsp:Transcript_62989/g.184224  ORF Transcript_62989/g.184224 Transcript_62989/m.184224 type:complete len:240 (-) Transcript_62989:390-1109(-)
MLCWTISIAKQHAGNILEANLKTSCGLGELISSNLHRAQNATRRLPTAREHRSCDGSSPGTQVFALLLRGSRQEPPRCIHSICKSLSAHLFGDCFTEFLVCAERPPESAVCIYQHHDQRLLLLLLLQQQLLLGRLLQCLLQGLQISITQQHVVKVEFLQSRAEELHPEPGRHLLAHAALGVADFRQPQPILQGRFPEDRAPWPTRRQRQRLRALHWPASSKLLHFQQALHVCALPIAGM